jgi:hypothetical protein
LPAAVRVADDGDHDHDPASRHVHRRRQVFVHQASRNGLGGEVRAANGEVTVSRLL